MKVSPIILPPATFGSGISSINPSTTPFSTSSSNSFA